MGILRGERRHVALNDAMAPPRASRPDGRHTGARPVSGRGGAAATWLDATGARARADADDAFPSLTHLETIAARRRGRRRDEAPGGAGLAGPRLSRRDGARPSGLERETRRADRRQDGSAWGQPVGSCRGERRRRRRGAGPRTFRRGSRSAAPLPCGRCRRAGRRADGLIRRAGRVRAASRRLRPCPPPRPRRGWSSTSRARRRWARRRATRRAGRSARRPGRAGRLPPPAR